MSLAVLGVAAPGGGYNSIDDIIASAKFFDKNRKGTIFFTRNGNALEDLKSMNPTDFKDRGGGVFTGKVDDVMVTVHPSTSPGTSGQSTLEFDLRDGTRTVSYTHLTLPTILLV